MGVQVQLDTTDRKKALTTFFFSPLVNLQRIASSIGMIYRNMLYANKSGQSNQLLKIAKDNYIEQMVIDIEPTRITEDTENVLELFFSNNSSLVNRVEIIPGISDHETV